MVTCVMVTGHQPSRRKLALRAVESFRRQIYSPRELLIVNQGEPFGLPDRDIRELAVVTGCRTLGDLRNIGLLESQGQLVTAWDDDDFHGSRRILEQVEHGWPCMLQHMVVVDEVTREARAISAANWIQNGFPSTLLYPRDTNNRFPPLSRGEDDEFAQLFSCNRPLDNSPLDYIRFYHGNNTCSRQHFEKLFNTARDLTDYERHAVEALQWWIGHSPRRCTSAVEVKETLGSLRWMSLHTAQFLESLIHKHDLREVLEIGHLHGVSTCYFAATGADVTTVDLEHSRCHVPSVEDALKACGLTATIVRQPSRVALADWALAGRMWDLIYVDGSHMLADVWCDLLLADKVLRPGGWLVMDDIAHETYPGVRQVWERLPAQYDRQPGPHRNCGVARKRP